MDKIWIENLINFQGKYKIIIFNIYHFHNELNVYGDYAFFRFVLFLIIVELFYILCRRYLII